MAPRISFIEKIVPGTLEWRLRVRIIRLWKQTEYNNPMQIKSTELKLLDEKTARIQATIKRSLIEQFQTTIEKGSAYLIENLLVAKTDPKFKATKHKYKLSFMKSTKCTKFETDSIPKTYFDFLPFTKILEGLDQGFLFVVIGHVVEKDNIKEMQTKSGKKKLMDIILEDLE
ncbi:Replication protein A 70 kDa DNA-binding subunit A [Spatholobus suberectus]|nr:Replication protein A 70 kDa DNA-binding subunit A [Spatholobus suberectus]